MLPSENRYWGPFIYYVITFLGFLDPLRKHVFSTENNQKLVFSDPPPPPTSAYVIYEWSLSHLLTRWKCHVTQSTDSYFHIRFRGSSRELK